MSFNQHFNYSDIKFSDLSSSQTRDTIQNANCIYTLHLDFKDGEHFLKSSPPQCTNLWALNFTDIYRDDASSLDGECDWIELDVYNSFDLISINDGLEVLKIASRNEYTASHLNSKVLTSISQLPYLRYFGFYGSIDSAKARELFSHLPATLQELDLDIKDNLDIDFTLTASNINVLKIYGNPSWNVGSFLKQLPFLEELYLLNSEEPSPDWTNILPSYYPIIYTKRHQGNVPPEINNEEQTPDWMNILPVHCPRIKTLITNRQGNIPPEIIGACSQLCVLELNLHYTSTDQVFALMNQLERLSNTLGSLSLSGQCPGIDEGIGSILMKFPNLKNLNFGFSVHLDDLLYERKGSDGSTLSLELQPISWACRDLWSFGCIIELPSESCHRTESVRLLCQKLRSLKRLEYLVLEWMDASPSILQTQTQTQIQTQIHQCKPRGVRMSAGDYLWMNLDSSRIEGQEHDGLLCSECEIDHSEEEAMYEQEEDLEAGEWAEQMCDRGEDFGLANNKVINNINSQFSRVLRTDYDFYRHGPHFIKVGMRGSVEYTVCSKKKYTQLLKG